MDKTDKKARLKACREDERAKARALLPLPDAEMKALFDMLDQHLPERGCDHSRMLTEEWLRSHGHPVDPVIQWLDANGGFCDCEVLANAEQAWQEASRRA